ncbi:glycoside hydrolase family 30 protein [Frankia sp. Cr1]|uniref:glycoside hydrolase family 30 protein n=1 Tax=Frankia sp. Cr1 TaxID=3073931 RepID=UPI002AD5767F|nr:glycoside hydrolase family 30 beta sandwich domain-containing protein [Frankia sp. Cr1]
MLLLVAFALTVELLPNGGTEPGGGSRLPPSATEVPAATASGTIRSVPDAAVGGPAIASPSPLDAVRGTFGWMTVPGEVRLAALGASRVAFTDSIRAEALAERAVTATVDPAKRFQTIDGFGAALTESSAVLLHGLPTAQRDAVLRSLFDPVAGAGLSLVRVPMGASDFARTHYTYDDLASGQTDPGLERFSVVHDDATVIPVLREILAINPQVRVVATPWSAPAWMKTTGSLRGGSLRPEYANVWARYFVRFVEAYAARGIPVAAVTVQNEPGHADESYPSMTMSVSEQIGFIADQLGPAFATAGLQTLIVGYDHNWDNADFPMELLSDSAANRYVAGIAWHCYRGSPSTQSQVQARFPDKGVWLSECSAGAWHSSASDGFGWLASILIGTVHDWARGALLWNLALDPAGGPHLGGCADCRGILTITPGDSEPGSVTRSLEYDLLALASRAAPRGAVRVAVTVSADNLPVVGFVAPDGQRSLLVRNERNSEVVMTVNDGGPAFDVALPAKAVSAIRWSPSGGSLGDLQVR